MSELLQLRVAMAHAFKERGANGNLPPARCLACGLLRDDPVHSARHVAKQAKVDMSYVSRLISNWKGPGE